MPSNPSTIGETTPAQVRYHAVRSLADLSQELVLQPDEAFVVPTFDEVEALIASGVDSARVAVSQDIHVEGEHPPYSQVGPDKQLVPATPFSFDRSILIVLPTYNERQNLEAMVEAIGRYVVADILVVDDNSPDGTGHLADQLSQRQRHVHVMHRPKKEGLGPAYLAGFRWALTRMYQLIIEMDCDFSHAPWDLPRLVYRSRRADLVIGSRYIAGGGTRNWNFRRRLVSRLGNGYVSWFLGADIHDWTGGFRCYRRELLAEIGMQDVKAKGYVFQVEMAWRAKQLGAVISELPIRFTDRIHGQSKLGWQSIVEAMMHVPKMHLQAAACRIKPSASPRI